MRLQFYQSVKLVIGPIYSLIIDTQRGDIYQISTILGNFLNLLNEFDLKTLETEFLNETDMDSWVHLKDQLYKNDLVHLCSDIELSSFPEMESSFYYPNIISNLIIDFDDLSDKPNISNLDLIWSTVHVEVRFFNLFNIEKVLLILDIFQTLDVASLTVKINFSIFKMIPEHSFSKFTSIVCIEVYDSKENTKIYKNGQKFYYYDRLLLSEKSCGLVSGKDFITNQLFFNESLNHNNCLNRKVSIDKKGHIKNCPSSQNSYGNINTTSLKQIVLLPEFKHLWNFGKDQISICKDCEYRYVCLDCRAYVEDPDDILSKPLKCGYNPYTGEWSEWSTNPLKQKAIDFYGMREMVEGSQKSSAADLSS